MKHATSLYYLLSACILSFFATTANASASDYPSVLRFKEGVHFEKINNDAISGKHEVTEYFSFNCPACYRFNPIVVDYKKLKSDDISFRQVPVSFGRSSWGYSQKAFILLDLLKASKSIDEKIFHHIQTNHKPFNSDKDIIDFFAQQGFEKSKLEKLLNSFGAKSRMNQINRQIQQAKLSGVPTIIVNGKYRVNLNHAQTSERLKEIIDYLKTLS